MGGSVGGKDYVNKLAGRALGGKSFGFFRGSPKWEPNERVACVAEKLSENCKGWAEERRTSKGKKRIRSTPVSQERSPRTPPSGMTEGKARATAKARMQGSLHYGGKRRRLRSR
jgi:hypothetical protein